MGLCCEYLPRVAPSTASHDAWCVLLLSVDERWIGLPNALAGLFCASLGSLDDRHTSAFPLSSVPSPKDSIPYAFRYAPLPSESFRARMYGEPDTVPQAFAMQVTCRFGKAVGYPQRVFDADWIGMV